MKKHNIVKALMLMTAFSLVGGVAAVQSVSADDGAVFEVAATSIRTVDHETNGNGLRFAVVMDDATYESVTENANAEMGVLILPTDLVDTTDGLTLDDVSETGASKAVTYGKATGSDNAQVQVSEWMVSDVRTETKDYTDGYMMCVVYVWGTPQNAYNRPVTAVAYYDTDTTDATNAVQYSASKSASLSEVALRDDVDAYLNDYDVKFYNTDGTSLITEQSVTYGSSYEMPDMTDVVQGTGTENRPQYEISGWYQMQANGEWGTEVVTELPSVVTKNMKFKASLVEMDWSKNLMKLNEEGLVVYDGPETADGTPQWYYLEGSGKSVYLNTTITTDAVQNSVQAADGIIIKVGNVERRVLFAGSGVYVFTEEDGKYIGESGATLSADLYINSGLTTLDGTYAIYQSLSAYGKYQDTNVVQQTNKTTPYGTWYSDVRKYTWGNLNYSDFNCSNVVYVIDGGYLYIALGADSDNLGAYLKLDLKCMFGADAINEDTVYSIGYAAAGGSYYNGHNYNVYVTNPAYAFKTNSILFGNEATDSITTALALFA